MKTKSLIPFLFLAFPLSTVFPEEKKMPPLHHPVRIVPSDETGIPDDFRLDEQGRLGCKTCHAIDDIEDTPLDEIDRDDPDFLRRGPYASISDFCYLCHDKQDYPRLNIHKMLDEDGKIIESTCLYCHSKKPDPEKDDHEKIKFRLAPEKLCYGCHSGAPHLNSSTHHKKPSRKMLKKIKAAEEKQHVILPLDESGKLMCATCHNVHQPGVIDKNTPAGKQVSDADIDNGIEYQTHPWNAVYQEDKRERLARLFRDKNQSLPGRLEYRRIEKEILLRLPARDGTLCLACHDFDE